MSNPNRNPPEPESAIVRIASLLSVGYLLFAGVAMTRFTWPTQLNEWGDFLAGVFAPLAFGWLVLGYHLQRVELRLQRAELKATSDANKDQADQLRAQVELLAKQLQSEEAEADRRRRLDKAGSQPRLSVALDSYEASRLQMTVVNHGATAWRFGLRSWSGGWHLSPSDIPPVRAFNLDEVWRVEFIPTTTKAHAEGLMVSFAFEGETGRTTEHTFFIHPDTHVQDHGTKLVT